MEKKMYICQHPDSSTLYEGTCIKTAYENAVDDEGAARVEDCTFYEAIPINVEMKFVEVPTIKK